MYRRLHLLALILAALFAATTFGTAGHAAAEGYDPGAENEMAALVNNYRAQHGLAPLQIHTGYREVARGHTSTMAAQQHLHHNPNLSADADRVIPGWTLIAENVGFGGSTQAVHQAFLDSPKHRQNILTDRFTILAVGAVRTADGTYYFTQNFADWHPPAAPAPQPQPQPAPEAQPAPPQAPPAQVPPAPAEEPAPAPVEPVADPEPEPEPEPSEEPVTADVLDGSPDEGGSLATAPGIFETLALFIASLVGRLVFWS